MEKTKNTYKKSGVNIGLANSFVKHIARISKKNVKKKSKIAGSDNIGAFGSIYDISKTRIKDPLIVTGLAFLLNTPIVSNLLAKYLPKLFSSGVSTSIQYISLLLKSIIIGVLFFALKTIV